MPFPPLLLPLLGLLPPPVPDEGWGLVFLDVPRRAVLGDLLPCTLRTRPGNPYILLADVARGSGTWRGVRIHLALTGSMVVLGSGITPPNGIVAVRVATPRVRGIAVDPLLLQGFAADGSVVGMLGASDSKAVSLVADDNQPIVGLLTVNGIPQDQNGSELREGTLVVPEVGFTVDLSIDERGRGPVTTLNVTADQTVGTFPPGTDLARFFTLFPGGASALVTPAWIFPANTRVTLTAWVGNAAGRRSPPVSFTCDVSRFGTTERPFAQRQSWFLDFDTHDLDRSGIPDFREDLLAYGLGASATETSGPSFAVNEWVRDAIVARMQAIYASNRPDGARVDFFRSRPASPYHTMCVGGRNPYPASQLPPGARETTGAAYLNSRNQRKSITNCNGVVGVHPRSIFHLFKDTPDFARVFLPLQQNPVGLDPRDPVVTAPGFDPTTAPLPLLLRYREIEAGVGALVNATSFILAQETGHSMGLMAMGLLGAGGLLAGERDGHSTAFHTDDGLGNYMSGNNSTPAPAQAANLALIWDHFQSGRGHWTPLAWAYLTERVINR